MKVLRAIFVIFAFFCAVVESGVMRKILQQDPETKKNAVEVEEVFVAKQNAQKVFENMTTETQSPAEKLLATMQISVPIFFPSAFMKEGDRTGNHEAGHDGACKLNPHCTRITYMTTIPDPRTNSRGRTDFKTRPNYNKKQLESFVEMFLGGSMSEGVLTGPIDLAGLQNDLKMAYNITCLLIQHFGENIDPEFTIEWSTPCQMNEEMKDKAGTLLIEIADRMLPRFQDEHNKKILQELATSVTEKGWLMEEQIYKYLDRLH